MKLEGSSSGGASGKDICSSLKKKKTARNIEVFFLTLSTIAQRNDDQKSSSHLVVMRLA
jgi:hypothetical protein